MGDDLPARLVRQLGMAQRLTRTGSWEWDLATNAVTWSDELYRIYGLEPQSVAITFESFLARVHEHDRAHTTEQVQAALARGTGLFEYSERIVRDDGTVRHLRTIGEVVVDASGRAVGLVGACRDVTDEVERVDTIALFEDFFHNAQIGMAVLHVADPKDAGSARLVSFNPAAETIARRPLVELLGAPLRDVVPFAPEGVLFGLVTSVAREGVTREATVLRSRDPRDPDRALSIKAFPLPGDCVGVSLDDITRETRAHRLRDTEARVLERIASGAPLEEILDAVARGVEEEARGVRAAILLRDEHGRLQMGVGPSLPKELVAAACTEFDPKPAFAGATQVGAHRAVTRSFWSKDERALGRVVAFLPDATNADDDGSLAELIARASRVAGIAVENRQLAEQARALAAHVESVREEERTAIARELHDALGQMLTALKLDVAWLGRRATGETVASQLVRDHVTGMSAMIDELVVVVRRMSAELRPVVLDDLGLAAAIEWQAEEFERRTQVECNVRVDVEDRSFEPALSTAVFRVFQEALTNVARHAEAKRVDVRLRRDASWLMLDVEDDGRGITPDQQGSSHSLGLVGIRERARRLGGTATIGRAGAGGTSVSLRVPLQPHA
jgi:PAS domain S-box-containing protein